MPVASPAQLAVATGAAPPKDADDALASVWAYGHDLALSAPKFGPNRADWPFIEDAGRKLMAALEAAPDPSPAALLAIVKAALGIDDAEAEAPAEA